MRKVTMAHRKLRTLRNTAYNIVSECGTVTCRLRSRVYHSINAIRNSTALSSHTYRLKVPPSSHTTPAHADRKLKSLELRSTPGLFNDPPTLPSLTAPLAH